MAPEHRQGANGHRYREAKKRFVKRAEPLCAICGKFVDKTLKFPHPGSPSVDHIVPLARGGHATDPNNWQLACLSCNRWKSDKLAPEQQQPEPGKPYRCPHPHHLSRQHWPDQEVEPCPHNPNRLHHVSRVCACADLMNAA